MDCLKTLAHFQLPFLAFELDPLGDEIRIQWKVSETDNYYFIVERSTEGTTFESIAIVDSRSELSTINSYSFIDPINDNTNYYYRIKQVDKDGGVSISPVRSIKSGVDFQKIYPNPSNGIFNIKVGSGMGNDNSGIFHVYDSNGNIVMLGKVDEVLKSGVIDLKEFPVGIYFVKFQYDNIIVTDKLIIE